MSQQTSGKLSKSWQGASFEKLLDTSPDNMDEEELRSFYDRIKELRASAQTRKATIKKSDHKRRGIKDKNAVDTDELVRTLLGME